MSAISIRQAQAAGFGMARIALLVADLLRRFAELQPGIRFGHGRSARRARFDAALATADPAIASAVAERNGQTWHAPDLPRIKRYETLTRRSTQVVTSPSWSAARASRPFSARWLAGRSIAPAAWLEPSGDLVFIADRAAAGNPAPLVSGNGRP